MPPPNPFETRVLPYDDAAVAEAAQLILSGGVVAVPTETVYGLAADATDAKAVARIYEAKARPAFNPLIIHVSSLEEAEALALFDEHSRALARRCWPGPLTLVLPLRAGTTIASLATAGLNTIALRVPAHPAIRALIASTGRPLAAPSANASGRISPTRAEHVVHTLGGRIPLVIDAGSSEAGLESTIVAIADGVAQILRPGPIDAAELGMPTADPPPDLSAPGRSASHYCPSKPVALNHTSRSRDKWLIGFGEIEGDSTLSPAADLVEAASRLYACLHEADGSDRETIALAPIPDFGLGAAINDRLRRAAAR